MKHLFVVFCMGFVVPAFAQKQAPASTKISPALRSANQAGSRDSIAVVLYRSNHFEKRMLSPAQIAPLLTSDTSITFVEWVRIPKEEFASGNLDLTLNRINLAHRHFEAVNGTGLAASIKEQRFDVQDIDIKGRIFSSGIEAQTQSAHASAMASILAGAGNSTPASKGVATGVSVSSSDFAALYPDSDAFYSLKNISVQNHSYGTAIENYYGADAAAYDQSAGSNPSLVHVFSAGNAGLETPDAGKYTGIDGYANLTGSFKMAKNIITVGSTDSSGNVAPVSSKGPSFDGRIKPELVAYSDDGTSGAAALVSGAAIVIQHLFKNLYDSLPHSDLVRAILYNSAYSPDGKPSYTHGYGSLDLNKALHTLHAREFLRGTIADMSQKEFSIQVPLNSSLLKVTIAWNDPAAAANSEKALMHDLNLSVKRNDDEQEWLPWVLNSKPNSSLLSLPAIRGTDTLNNAEQVSIRNPQPGTYTIKVRSNALSQGHQAFSVAYQIDSLNHFEWSYPTSFDKLQAGTATRLRWNTNRMGAASIQYSIGGSEWKTALTTKLENREAVWMVPDSVQQLTLRMRLSNGDHLPESEKVLITDVPVLQVGYRCGDSLLYWWNRKQTQKYQVYYLGDKYLQKAFTTTDSFFVVKQSQFPTNHFAVASIHGNDDGLRSYSVDYNTQGVDCYFQSFFATLEDDPVATLEATLGTLFGIREILIQKKTRMGFETIHSFGNPQEKITVFRDDNIVTGPNTYRTVLNLFSGRVIYSKEESVYYLPGNSALVYPNPVQKGKAVRVITREPGAYNLSINDLNGRIIKNVLLDDTIKQVDVSGMQKGMYLLRFVSVNNGHSFTRKLIVL